MARFSWVDKGNDMSAREAASRVGTQTQPYLGYSRGSWTVNLENT